MNWLCEACIHYPPSSCDGKPCSQCDPESHFNNHFESKELVIYVPSKNRETNADRIRSMTDEELADWIYGQCDEWSNWCPKEAPINPETFECLRNGGCCGKCILDWLKQEVEE